MAAVITLGPKPLGLNPQVLLSQLILMLCSNSNI